MEHRALLMEYRALLTEYRARLIVRDINGERAEASNVSLLMEYGAALLMEHRALLMEHRALLMECGALLMEYR